MIIKFKKFNESQLYEIEGENLTLIKVSIVVHYGSDTAFHVFQKTLDNNILLYLPNEEYRNNLVKRNFDKYVTESNSKIQECIKSIKKIDD